MTVLKALIVFRFVVGFMFLINLVGSVLEPSYIIKFFTFNTLILFFLTDFIIGICKEEDE